MNELTVLNTPAYLRFEGCARGMSGLISQGQYNWYFNVRGFAGASLRAEQIVIAAYPHLDSGCLKLEECSFEMMVKEIDHQLSEERPMWSMPGDPPRYAPFCLLPREHGFWCLMRECFEPDECRIFRATANDQLKELDWGISGGFTFVVLNEKESAGLIINAGNSD